MRRARHLDDRGFHDITVRLISSFKDLIANGTFVPGYKLPPERELAKRFGVNRTSLRQALKVLLLMGVLRQRVGDGTYLTTDGEHVLREPIEFMILTREITDEELLDARLIVETELAGRAAERATAQDLAALRRAIKDMKESRTDEARMEADLAFHEAIFQASGNRVCGLIFRVIHRAILASMKKIVRASDVDRPLKFHEALYTAIFNRDVDEAKRHMRDHLLDTKSQLNEQRTGEVDLGQLKRLTARRPHFQNVSR